VTPRYHHVHHSKAPEHYRANLASRLTIWDRLFGTYVDPDHVDRISFGIEGAPSPVRVVIGL
jgi:sterol desaturase/sphingolipid hydroxylase (fatty acid hydroxylase superfamily)